MSTSSAECMLNLLVEIKIWGTWKPSLTLLFSVKAFEETLGAKALMPCNEGHLSFNHPTVLIGSHVQL
jgi:hypothetical protein